MEFADGLVNYEAFGAQGDGVTDDMAAICKAHAYANEHGMGVRTREDATYYIGGQALTAVIATNTDWNTSRFNIDDVKVEDNKASVFQVRSQLQPVELKLDRLARDQKQVDAQPGQTCFVRVENDNKKQFIRRGLNENQGVPQQDCFVLSPDGSVTSPIDWDYDEITRIEAQPIADIPLVLRGGVFTTFANRMKKEVGYDYWARNIKISRSNTEVDGLTHYVVGETATGHPYSGFLSISHCANVTLRNCFATGHKIYSTVGSAGKPVRMGSYDYSAHGVVDFRMINCSMNHITDRTRWGVIGTNHCKNVLLEDCRLSRMDTHMGISGTYAIRRSTLGHMGLNAIGRGTLTIEDSNLYGNALVNLRPDYGSTWQGDLVIRNSRWTPACGRACMPHMIHTSNDGMHDFGYPCSLPNKITIDKLFVDDSNHPDKYEGMFLIKDPDDAHFGIEQPVPTDERPFPYDVRTEIEIRELTTASGKKPRVSPSERVCAHAVLIGKE